MKNIQFFILRSVKNGKLNPLRKENFYMIYCTFELPNWKMKSLLRNLRIYIDYSSIFDLYRIPFICCIAD